MAKFELIDDYNVFDLMNLHDLDEAKKETILTELNELILKQFIFERVPLLITRGQQIELLEKMEKKTDLDTLAEFLERVVPNFMQLLFEYTREHKILYIDNHYSYVLQQCEEMLDKVDSENAKRHLERRKTNYAKAKDLLLAEEYQQIIELFGLQDHYDSKAEPVVQQ